MHGYCLVEWVTQNSKLSQAQLRQVLAALSQYTESFVLSDGPDRAKEFRQLLI